MRQPDLGLKVADLRQQKGMTQEQLAEKCEVTLQCLSDTLQFDFMEENASNENLWLVLLHLSSAIPLLIFPLLIWSWKKNQSYKIDKQGHAVLNFQITMLLLMFLGGFLLMLVPTIFTFLGKRYVDTGLGIGLFEIMLLCAPMPVIFIGIFCTYQGVVNAMRALSSKPIRYPLSIPFIR